MRVLIVLPGAIGDVVRALPLLGRLRRGWPQAHIGWAVEPPSAPLLAGHPWLDEPLLFARTRGTAAFLPFLRQVRERRFALTLDLGRSIKSAVIARASGAPERLGFARADAREGSWLLATRHLPAQDATRSKLEQFLAFGDLLGLPPVRIGFGLTPTLEEVAGADTLLAGLPRPLVAACVGSSCASRYWFPERTAAFLSALGASAVLLGTAADAPFTLAVRRAMGGAVRDLAGRTTLRQLLAVLSRVDLAVGPDSGALHIAAAVGTRVVSLWGATSAARSSPFGSEAWTVAGTAPCAPCFLRDCPIGRICMQTITVDAVLARAREALAA
jgi:ADP-heptose:LPS heptosyltransferase